MDVEEYLRLVREEAASLPDVCIADSPGHSREADGKTAKQFERLLMLDGEAACIDAGFQLSEDELHFFQSMKAKIQNQLIQPKSQKKCSLLIHCVSLLTDSRKDHETVSRLEDIKDPSWSMLFSSHPPDILKMCKKGVSYATINDLLHRLASFVCERRGININEQSSLWLFNILLLLDELHAMVESVSYELQLIKRAFSRKLQMMKESSSKEPAEDGESNHSTQQMQRTMANLILIICIIQQHFKQR